MTSACCVRRLHSRVLHECSPSQSSHWLFLHLFIFVRNFSKCSLTEAKTNPIPASCESSDSSSNSDIDPFWSGYKCSSSSALESQPASCLILFNPWDYNRWKRALKTNRVKKKKKIPIYWLQLEGCLPALMLMHVTWLRYIKLITNATVA